MVQRMIGFKISVQWDSRWLRDMSVELKQGSQAGSHEPDGIARYISTLTILHSSLDGL
jgi:hypothetical protein